MATKAGRVEIRDIKPGKTFWKAAIVEGQRVPQPVIILGGAHLASMKRADGSPVAIWVYQQLARDETGNTGRQTVICDPMWTPAIDGEPIFDKLFVNRAAVVRWIRRYASNRIDTLCEDRRVFECGSRPLRAIAAQHPDQLDLAQVLDHRFQHTELGLARHFGAHRRAMIMETPNG
jgi:hypothetical protein